MTNNFGKSATDDIRKFSNASSEALSKLSQQRALKLFHQAAERVPAYKAFLRKQGVNPGSVENYKDLTTVPWIDKENYFREYPLADLAWDGELANSNMIARSSGSSGNPFYWPSGEMQVNEVEYFYEAVFNTMFDMDKKNTLVVIAYGMGSWVAGTMTLLSGIEYAKEHKATFATPGYNRSEVVEIVQQLGPNFDQVVICSYPPLLKEILDTGTSKGLEWSKYNPRFVLGAESISEEFRDYIHQISGADSVLLSSMNTIGSADAMVIGHETPISIAVRRQLNQRPELAEKVYSDQRTPTLAQFYPWQKDLYVQDSELIITADSGIPLIRYNIHDNADIYTYDDIEQLFKSNDMDLGSLVSDINSEEFSYDWKLPFVTIYGKSTNALKFYGAFIYPENVKVALESPAYVSLTSGKFVMHTEYDELKNQALHILVELAPEVVADQIDTSGLEQAIVKATLEHNTEYGAVHADIGKKAVPKVSLAPFDSDDFKYTIKHRYTKDS